MGMRMVPAGMRITERELPKPKGKKEAKKVMLEKHIPSRLNYKLHI
jgi:hypothetical protein